MVVVVVELEAVVGKVRWWYLRCLWWSGLWGDSGGGGSDDDVGA